MKPSKKPLVTATLNITNCTQCPHHKVLPDPDPLDWFCDDDVKVVCLLFPEERQITCACRPYQVEKECSVPKWCPLRK